MSTKTNSALRGLLTRFNDYADLNELTDNAEAFARALIAECCTDLVIVPREPTAQMVAAIENVNCKYETMPEFYSALLLAAQPTAQEK